MQDPETSIYYAFLSASQSQDLEDMLTSHFQALSSSHMGYNLLVMLWSKQKVWCCETQSITSPGEIPNVDETDREQKMVLPFRDYKLDTKK